MFRQVMRSLLATCLLAGVGMAHADEAAVKEAIEAFIGVAAVKSVAGTPYGGLYEVVLDSGELIYTDEKVSFIIDGRIIDTRTRRDMTQARLNDLATIDFGDLPLEHAIKQVRGDGKRVIASFEDPNCGYCKRLGEELAAIDNVTLYTFLFPILSADSDQKSRNIWCAEDRAAAWNGWILDGKTPAQANCDTAAVDANVALGRKLGIQGTPTIFLGDGRRIGGFVPAAQLEQMLSDTRN